MGCGDRSALPVVCQLSACKVSIFAHERSGYDQPACKPTAPTATGALTWPMRPSGASLALKPSRFSSSREAGFSGVQICTADESLLQWIQSV